MARTAPKRQSETKYTHQQKSARTSQRKSPANTTSQQGLKPNYTDNGNPPKAWQSDITDGYGGGKSCINPSASLPTRDKIGIYHFSDHREFTPNLSPKEVLQRGSFGGYYFRSIHSNITNETLKDAWKEFPSDWFEGLDIQHHVANPNYDEQVNKYKLACGQSKEAWETKGWITETDPFGWFQWYCRFFLGRRTDDDDRQINRWMRLAGPTGRWKNGLISKLARVGKNYDDTSVSPIIRQILQHWGYELLKMHFDKEAPRFRES